MYVFCLDEGRCTNFEWSRALLAVLADRTAAGRQVEPHYIDSERNQIADSVSRGLKPQTGFGSKRHLVTTLKQFPNALAYGCVVFRVAVSIRYNCLAE